MTKRRLTNYSLILGKSFLHNEAGIIFQNNHKLECVCEEKPKGSRGCKLIAFNSNTILGILRKIRDSREQRDPISATFAVRRIDIVFASVCIIKRR